MFCFDFCVRKAVSKLYQRHPNLGLVNISRPEPQTAYVDMKKITIVSVIFGSKLLNSFSISKIYLFLKYLR